MTDLWLGRVTAVSPLTVERNGRPGAQPAELSAGQTAGTIGSEVLCVTIEGRRLVLWRKP